MTKDVDLRGLPRSTLLALADRACSRLCSIAGQLTTDEGDKDATEEAFGLDASEVVEMAHDNMIADARRTLDSIIADAAKALGTSTVSAAEPLARQQRVCRSCGGQHAWGCCPNGPPTPSAPPAHKMMG